MTKWITDRLPTEADADKDGDVEIPYRPDNDDHRWQHWSFIVPGQPWFSLNARPLANVAAAEPASTAPPAASEPPAPPTQPEPTFEEVYAQAELEHLRAKTRLLEAKAYALTRPEPGTPGINLASMPYKALLRLQGDIVVELSAREA